MSRKTTPTGHITTHKDEPGSYFIDQYVDIFYTFQAMVNDKIYHDGEGVCIQLGHHLDLRLIRA